MRILLGGVSVTWGRIWDRGYIGNIGIGYHVVTGIEYLYNFHGKIEPVRFGCGSDGRRAGACRG